MSPTLRFIGTRQQNRQTCLGRFTKAFFPKPFTGANADNKKKRVFDNNKKKIVELILPAYCCYIYIYTRPSVLSVVRCTVHGCCFKFPSTSRTFLFCGRLFGSGVYEHNPIAFAVRAAAVLFERGRRSPPVCFRDAGTENGQFQKNRFAVFGNPLCSCWGVVFFRVKTRRGTRTVVWGVTNARTSF